MTWLVALPTRRGDNMPLLRMPHLLIARQRDQAKTELAASELLEETWRQLLFPGVNIEDFNVNLPGKRSPLCNGGMAVVR